MSIIFVQQNKVKQNKANRTSMLCQHITMMHKCATWRAFQHVCYVFHSTYMQYIDADIQRKREIYARMRMHLYGACMQRTQRTRIYLYCFQNPNTSVTIFNSIRHNCLKGERRANCVRPNERNEVCKAQWEVLLPLRSTYFYIQTNGHMCMCVNKLLLALVCASCGCAMCVRVCVCVRVSDFIFECKCI